MQTGPTESSEGRRIDPLVLIVLGFGLVVLLAAFVLVKLLDEPEEVVDIAPLPVAAADAGVPDLLGPVDAGPTVVAVVKPEVAAATPRTRKGQLMKRELEKRALAAAAQKPQVFRVALSASGEHGALVLGDLKRKLRGVDFAPDAPFALSLRVDEKGGAGVVELRCSIAVSEMPQRRLIAQFSSTTEAQGGPDGELLLDASAACAASLAEDLRPWLARQQGSQ